MGGYDYVLVGGGLQSGLIVLALRARQPRARILLVERSGRLAGNHTWCFHDGDVPPSAREWLAPLITYRWTGYRIHFPNKSHTVPGQYFGVSSERLHEVVSHAVEDQDESRLLTSTEVVELGPDRVRFSDGEEAGGTVIVDARGPLPLTSDSPAGYQKFIGLELELDAAHGMDLPIVMDATVDQSQGYRFMYVLPLSERTVLVEDTYFHDSPVLDADRVRAGIRRYVERKGWTIHREVREERGVLPMPWKHELPRPGRGPLLAGYRGGWFHPGTGYSFPVATRLAEFVAGRPGDELFGPDLDRFARSHRRQAWFPRYLNRLLFRWYPPPARRAIFERVYRLPPETVRNFYALDMGWRDRARLLVGRPPKGLSIRHRLGHS